MIRAMREDRAVSVSLMNSYEADTICRHGGSEGTDSFHTVFAEETKPSSCIWRWTVSLGYVSSRVAQVDLVGCHVIG